MDLLREEYEVIAPFYGRGRDTCFDTVTDANRHLVQVHIPNPYYPPKRYVLPHIQQLLRIHLNDQPRIQPSQDASRRAIFGIRSCDTAGIDHRDRFFLGRDFKDAYYERHRQNLFLVNVVCTDPDLDIDDDCFCMCADTEARLPGAISTCRSWISDTSSWWWLCGHSACDGGLPLLAE